METTDTARTDNEIAAACEAYGRHDREIAIRVESDGRLAVSVYAITTQTLISGTRFQSWPAVLKLISRVEREGYHAVIFVREG